MLKLSVILLCGLLYVDAAMSRNQTSSDPPEVTTPLGKVKGSLMETRLGKTIYAFRGIRYGEPPIGQLRFKQAEPVKSWEGTFDASKEGPSCGWLESKLQSEDCLRLNVYTTKLGDHSLKTPVIVFFHPGGFYGFSGQSYLFGPQYLLDEEVVLVTTNYRLGAIGFTATGDAEFPGNLGLKDQVQALRWVQQNIAAFNGDPECVTIVGYSAGSWSVALHMLSPMSRGLFHRAVAMSGSPTKGEQLQHQQLDLAKKQARLVGCPSESTRIMRECFEKVPADKMAATVRNMTDWGWDPIRFWSAVVEPDIPGLERFIVEQPVDSIRCGNFYSVPFMSGSTLDEFGGQALVPVVAARHGNNSVFDDLNANWDHIAPIAFQFQRNSSRSKRISDELRDFYFKNETIGLQNWQALAHLYGDAIVSFPIHRIVDLVSRYSDQPVYYYHFVYPGRYSWHVWSDTKKPFGVVHHDDLMYLFYMQRYFPYFNETAPEIPTVEHITAMWASFAKTGNPIPKDNPLFKDVTWEPFQPETGQYLEINSTLTMKFNLNAERMEAFERIFPLEEANFSLSSQNFLPFAGSWTPDDRPYS
ncbi:GSCOCT00013629001.2-RA-CDS [Cotesia congregata]|uniref:Carboxylesterase clade D member 1 n=1 Tax=Cotesia congregata TaxID=51543 RepID=A0A8J2GZR2_COTCN|nr:GSCOCT00013629001.2-RA-CDS [Cotesia congregata]CAG5074242.1 carboxylesterase clade D member 1 [Cotesia congregata]